MNSELKLPEERMLKLQASYKLFQKLNQALKDKPKDQPAKRDESPCMQDLIQEAQEVSNEFDAQEIRSACENNLDLWAGILAPEESTSPFADFHHALFSLLTEACKPKHFEKYAIGVPRGFAKTQFIKLLIDNIITFTHHRFILTIGNTATLLPRM